MPVATKQCSRCRETKPITEFHRDRHNTDGHTYECKTCRLGDVPPGTGKGETYTHRKCGGTLYPDSENGPGIANYDWYRCDRCRLPGYLAA